MKLSDFFSAPALVRDAEFRLTHMPSSPIPQSICYVPSLKVAESINLNNNIVGVITTMELAKDISPDKGVVLSDHPQRMYYEFHNELVNKGMVVLNREHFIHPTALIARTAIIGNNVVINENVTVGHGTIIQDNTIIGANTRIEQNVLIGACGMQNATIDGSVIRLAYAGGVIIGKNCELLAFSVVQRPYHAFYTEIGDNTRISVRVNVGHGSKVGSDTFIAGSAQIAGNCRIGNNVWIGPSSTIADAISVGNRAKVRIGSVVINDIKEGDDVSGNFAIPHNKSLKNCARLRR